MSVLRKLQDALARKPAASCKVPVPYKGGTMYKGRIYPIAGDSPQAKRDRVAAKVARRQAKLDAKHISHELREIDSFRFNVTNEQVAAIDALGKIPA